MKTIITTSGPEQMLSSIYTFMINQSGGDNSNNNSSMNNLLISLEQAQARSVQCFIWFK